MNRQLVRRRVLELMIAIGVLHVTAIALYYLLRIPASPTTMQRRFGWIWMGLTIVVVAVGLRRVKVARRR